MLIIVWPLLRKLPKDLQIPCLIVSSDSIKKLITVNFNQFFWIPLKAIQPVYPDNSFSTKSNTKTSHPTSTPRRTVTSGSTYFSQTQSKQIHLESTKLASADYDFRDPQTRAPRARRVPCTYRHVADALPLYRDNRDARASRLYWLHRTHTGTRVGRCCCWPAHV